MRSREVRLAPSSLTRVLLLLVPLALLGTALMGLLAQSALAEHAVTPPTAVTVDDANGIGSDTTPTWSFTLPESTDTATCRLDGPTGNVFPQAPCTSPFTPATALSPDGAYVFTVATVRTAYETTDPSATPTVTMHPGGTSSEVSSSYLLDTGTPTTTVVGPSTASYTGWTVTRTDSGGSTVSYSCALVTGSTVGSSSVCSPGTVKPSLPASGTYALQVVATDAAGNSSTTTSAPYTYDGDPPTVSFTDPQPTGPSRSLNPAWTYTIGDGGLAPTCTLTGPSGTAGIVECSPTGFTASLPDSPSSTGGWVLRVTSVDAAGNSTTATSATYVLDRTPPTITITPGSSSGTGATITWTVSVTGGTITGCTVTGATSSGACSTAGGTLTATLPTDGTATLTVTATDGVFNPATSQVTYTRSTAPTAPAVSVPATRAATNPQTWSFTVDGQTTSVTCRLQQGSTVLVQNSCTTFTGTAGTFAYTLPGDGTYTLYVTAGNTTSSLTATGEASYTLDATEPVGPDLTRSPSATTGSATTISWTWTASGTTECLLTIAGVQQGTWAPCNSGSFSTPTDPAKQGLYTLQVRYYDDLDNRGTPSSSSYLFDSLAPGAPGVALVGPSTRQPGAVQWNLSLSGDGVRFQCRLVTGADANPAWADCASPHTLTLAEGVYQLQVRQVDAAGNASVATSSDITVDGTAPPAPKVTGGPSNDTNRTLTWTLEHTSVDGKTFVCRLLRNGAGPADPTACSSNYSVTVTQDGTYVLEVASVDAAGNVGAFTPSAARTVDTTGPLAPTVTLAVTRGNTKSATWTVTPSETGTTSQCRLTRTAGSTTSEVFGWRACTSYTFDLLAGDGVYVLHVRTLDPLNNVGGETEGPGYTLDATPPPAPGVVGSRDGTTHSFLTASYTFAGEGTATCRLYRTGTPAALQTVNGCLTGHVFTLPRESGSYYVEVTYTDGFDNSSAPGRSGTYVLDVTAPDAPLVVGSLDGKKDNVLALTYAFSGEGTATCRLYRTGSATPVQTTSGCTATGQGFAVTLPGVDGTYRLEVTYTDAYGNTGSAGVSGLYELDITKPGLATVTVTPRTDNVKSATWTVVLPEAGATAECQLRYLGGAGKTVRAWHPCTDGSYALLEGDGEYVLDVRVTDAVGNLGDEHTGQTYLLDTEPPAAPAVSRTGDPKDNVLTFTITFTKATTETATCQLRTPSGAAVGAAFECVSGQVVTVPNISGTYVLHVALTDAVGNTGAEGRAPPYELDVTAPDAPGVSSDRVGTDNEKVATFTFTVEGTATCQLLYKGQPVGDPVPCTSPYVVTLSSGDGAYQLVVTDTDAVGNTSLATTTAPYVLDLTAPPAPAVSGPATTGNTRAVTWTYAGEGTATCTLLLDGVVSGVAVSCGATGASATLPSDGSWSLRVTFTDAVGNTGPPGTSSTYLLDTVLPVAPTVTGPTGPAQSRTPSWTVATESGTTTECRLVRGATVVSDWAPCSAGFTGMLDGLPDGGYVLESRATDAAQNLGPVGSSAPYVLDTTAPLPPVVSGPSGPSQLRTPGFTWTGEAGTTAECQLSLDGTVVGGWVACASGYAPTLTKDGTWTLAVRLTDAARNVSDAATTGGYVLDTTPPDMPVVTPPKTPGRDLAPSWGAVVEGGTTLECRLTGADGVVSAWAACALPLTTSLAGRPDGSYVLEVRATDAAGNLSPVGSGTYVLDTVAPAAAVITSPAGGRSRTPTFTFTVEPGATTRCRLTSGTTVVSDFAACSSPVPLNLTGLPDGTYTLTVRVLDAAGNPGPAATGTYVLDTTGPAAPVLTLAPATPSPARSITWAFTSEPDSTLICRLTFPTGAVREIAGCASPLTVDLTGLPDGSYTLTVRAVDAAGNVGAALTEVHVLDSSAIAPPTVTGPVTPGSTRTPRWTFSGTATECRLTRGTTVLRDWAACTGSFTADLFGQPDGTYVLSVRSKDVGGAVSAATTSRYVLDTTAPGAATLVAPPTPSTNRMPTWSIASNDLGATAECRVLVFGSVLQDWAPCAVSPAGALHPVDLTGLGDGTYTLVVRLTDAAGNRSTVEASSSYVLDTSAPVAVGITGPPTPGNDLTPTWTLSSGAGAVLECRLTSAAGVVSDWAPCAGEYVADLTGLPDGIYTLAVRAVSAAGTPGPDTTDAYELNTSAPNAPTALALSSGIKPTDNDRSPSWTFTLPAGTTGQCHVVQGTRVVFDGPCSSPFRLDLSRAQDGSYTLTVRAISAAGTPGAAATSTYVLDTEPTAEPVFTQVPGSTGSTLDPQWRFSVARGATAQCRLLFGGAPLDDWTACQTPFTAQLTGRPDGTYTLQVRAVDAAGNTSAPVSNAYVLDRTAAPVPTFSTTPPSTGFDRTVSWSFSAPEGTTLECRVLSPDGSATAWGGCGPASPALRLAGLAVLTSGTYALDLTGRADGLYTLEVRAVEADGRRGAAASSGYRYDTRPPDMPSYTKEPDATGSDPKPLWLWDLGSDQLVECRLVRSDGTVITDWQECPESQYTQDLSRFGQGTYALELRVTDAAGNVGPARSASYRYDTTPPAPAVFTSRPPVSGSDRTVSWTFSAVDGRATCTVTRDRTRVREGPCSGRYDLDLAGLPDGVYTLTVIVTDAAGNPSRASSGTYTLRTVGLAGPVRVDPPTRPTDPGVREERTPTGPGRGGTGIGGTPSSEGSAPGTGVPIQRAEGDVVRASQVGPTLSAPRTQEEATPRQQPQPQPTGDNPLLPRALPVEDVPDVLRELVTGTAGKPTLPLALLAIVILFLLAQNRIDRRDPKLAAAPVEAEPELDFTAFVRSPRSALS